MKSLSRAAVFSLGLILTAKGLSLLKEVLLAYKYGTSYLNDAYSICISLPPVLFAVFASGIAQSYIPTMSRIEGKRERAAFFNNVMTTLFLASIVLCVICVVFDKNIVHLLAPGFNEETAELTRRFVDIIIWFLPLYVIFNILSAESQVNESFVMPNFCDNIVVNTVIIVFILISTKATVDLIVIGQDVSILIAVIILGIYCWSVLGTRYRPLVSFRDKNLALLFKLALPLGISVMANQINSVTDRIFSSYIGEGITSALGYANRVQFLFLTLTTTVFMSICFPRMNTLFFKGKTQDGLCYVEKGILLASLIAIPFMMVMIVYSAPVIRILFERGVFNARSTQITSECLVCYAVGIPFYALAEIGNKTLAASLKQRCIMKNTLIMVSINIILDLLLINALRHRGLALATSISGMVSVALIYSDLHRFRLLPMIRPVIRQTAIISIAAAASTAVSLVLYRIASGVRGIPFVLSFVASIMLFGLVYALLCAGLKVSIFSWLLSKIREIGRKA